MPIYSFQCEKGHKFDKTRKVEERHETIKCDECGSKAIRTVERPSPAQFKGRGWTPKFHG